MQVCCLKSVTRSSLKIECNSNIQLKCQGLTLTSNNNGLLASKMVVLEGQRALLLAIKFFSLKTAMKTCLLMCFLTSRCSSLVPWKLPGY